MPRTLILGTRNRKKAEELKVLLNPLGIELETLDDLTDAVDVEESGDTFVENATLKAVEQAKHLGRWVLGEDSGLCVDALDGRPGVYSARYSGENATDEGNNDKLLSELKDTPLEKRTAHYVCCAVLADPQGNAVASAEGRCHGRMRFERDGEGGFGYDPLFEVVEYHKTFGRLGDAVKSALSHRSQAIRRLIPQLKAIIRRKEWQED